MKLKQLLVSFIASLACVTPAFATARTSLTPFQMPSLYADAAPNVSLVTIAAPVAADATNFNSWTLQNGDILQAKNTGGSTYTLTIHSVKDGNGRTADLVLSLTAGTEVAITIPQGGYKQADGTCYVDASNIAITLRVLRRP